MTIIPCGGCGVQDPMHRCIGCMHEFFGPDHDTWGQLKSQVQPVAPDKQPIEGIITPWMPETNPIRLAVLGKLGEELNEAGARVMRCIIHGLEEKDPATGRTNAEELRREIADIRATIQVAEQTLSMLEPDDIMLDRQRGKVQGFKRWHKMIRNMMAGRDPMDGL